MEMRDQKVFVLALDGATLDLISPWVNSGYLPHIGRLIREGISGSLQSIYPPLTGPAWSSFMTGKSPGNHGVLEFFRRQSGSYRQVLNSRLSINGKSLWGLLSEAGKSVVVMNIPMTYPPEPVNGCLITGLLTPYGRRDFTYPPGLLEELEAHLGGSYLHRHDEKYRASNPYALLREQHAILDNNLQAALYLMEHKPWDFFMLHFLGTDIIQHEMWHNLDADHPQHNPVEREQLGNVILDFYQHVDNTVGRLMELIDESTSVILMSDHGFGPVYKFINFNTWLIEQGLLRLKQTPGTWLRHHLFKLGLNYSVMGHLVLRMGLGHQAKKIGRSRREELQRRLFLSLNDVDWSQSTVYSIGNFGQFYVNLKGREPEGIVHRGEEYTKVLADLTRRLQELRDPETGQPVIGEIMTGDQVYQGLYLECAPDLVFFTRNMEYKAMGLSDFSSPKVFEPVYGTTGHHRMNGVLICSGSGVFKESQEITGARIQDLAPTILYAMGQVIPRAMDGVVLFDLFTPEFVARRQTHYSENPDSAIDTDKMVLTDQEEAELMAVLRSLGYVT
jgi:predicted AlkP superfamily phosphohydrolase/phosphomutase